MLPYDQSGVQSTSARLAWGWLLAGAKPAWLPIAVSLAWWCRSVPLVPACFAFQQSRQSGANCKSPRNMLWLNPLTQIKTDSTMLACRPRQKQCKRSGTLRALESWRDAAPLCAQPVRRVGPPTCAATSGARRAVTAKAWEGTESCKPRAANGCAGSLGRGRGPTEGINAHACVASLEAARILLRLVVWSASSLPEVCPRAGRSERRCSVPGDCPAAGTHGFRPMLTSVQIWNLLSVGMCAGAVLLSVLGSSGLWLAGAPLPAAAPPQTKSRWTSGAYACRSLATARERLP